MPPETRQRYLPLPASALSQMCEDSPLPECLKEPLVLEYDTEVFPFRELVGDILGVAPSLFSQIHLTPEGCSVLKQEEEGALHRKRGKQGVYSKIWISSKGRAERQRFDQLLDRFVDDFIATRMGREVDGRSDVAYQKEPNLRVVLPSGEPYGYRHCDADYHHPPSEVNWWLPLTRVSGTNSLYVESKPGLGDFQPMELDYGQVLRFYGNLCQHYSVPNVSGLTRVSIDLRVINLQYHEQDWIDRLGRKCLFKVDYYYLRPGGLDGSQDSSDVEDQINLSENAELFSQF